MTDPAIINGDYTDLKFIKSRSVLQIVIEMPIEAGPSVVQMFGTPLPGQGVPVAIARLEERVDEPKPRRTFDEMGRTQQAGILCGDARFQEYLGIQYDVTFNELDSMTDQAATIVRRLCGVNSRANLDTIPDADTKWDDIERGYRQWA